MPIIPEHVWSAIDQPETYGGQDASLGSGAYRLVEYASADGAYRLTANDTYFRGPVRIPEVQQLNVPDETKLPSLQQGQIELVESADASVADMLGGSSWLKVLQTQPLSIVRLAVNTERQPLDQIDVRRAIMYALDRARIAQTLTRAPPIVASPGVIPPETPWYNPDPRVSSYTFDPDRARGLLNGQRYTLELLADPANREPELMQPMLADVGITLNVKRVDGKTRTQLLREGSFELGQVQHVGIGGDPDYLRRWYAGREANDFAQGSILHDPEFDQIAAQQATTLDTAARRELVDRMQLILAEQLPTIPLYYRRFYWVYDSRRYTPMNTWGGLMNGIPLVQNRLTFLRR